MPVPMDEPIIEAIKELSKKLGLKQDDIKVISIEEATWPDTSLGLPEKGMSYAQMLVEGYRIILSAGQKRFEVHTGNGIIKIRQ
jgi:hypothetical protein